MFLKILKDLKNNIISALGVLLVILGVVLLICVNTPQNKFERNMIKAEKAYIKGDLSKAVTKYTKAAEYKKSYPEAYVGLISSMEAAKADAEEIENTFMEGASLISEMKEEDREAQKDVIIEYFLHENVVFPDDQDKRIEALTIGYEATDGAEDIKRILTECISEKIDSKEKTGAYDEALALISDYSDKTDIDADNLTETILAEKEFSAEKEALLTRVYTSLKPCFESSREDTCVDLFSMDFADVYELDGAPEAEKIVSSFLTESYLKIMDGNSEALTGIGSGIYTFGSKYRTEKGGVSIPYYFYVGEFKDGIRDGFGVAFTTTGPDSYIAYVGEWKNNLPDGRGSRYEKVWDPENEAGHTRVYSGNWSENLALGNIGIVVTETEWPDVVFTGEAAASKGVCESQPTESDEYVVLNIRDGKLLSVLQSNTEGYALMLTLWQGENELLTAVDIN